MKGWLLLVVAFLLWPGCSSQNECEEPNEIDFGEIVSIEKAKYLENDRVQYRCNPGYVLEGPEWIQCKGQEWTPHPPKCLAPCRITRQQLAAKKLFVFGNQRKARLIQSNQNLQFQCNEGYVLVVPSVRKCVDGYMDFPLCISERGQSCRDPPRIENGDIIPLSEQQYRSGSSVEFRCQKYYAMEGQNRSFCDNGAWTKLPVCLEITCNSPKISNGTFQPQRNMYHNGDLIRVQCDSGFTLETDNGGKVVECTKNGWSPSPKCVNIEGGCGHPPAVDNADIVELLKETYIQSESVTYQCQNLYIMKGSARVTCQNGHWSKAPTCTAKGCDYVRIENGRMTEYLEWYKPFPKLEGQIIDFRCDHGFVPANQRTWQTWQTWQRAACINSRYVPEPKCLKICDPSIRFDHGRFIHHDYILEGNNITFVCDSGYSPADQQSTITCTQKGWSPAPRCILTAKGCDYVRIENGRMTEYLERYKPFPKWEGQTIDFRCDHGFVPANQQTGQTWQRAACINSRYVPEPKCLKVCDPSIRFDHGRFINHDYILEGNNITFVCEMGYSPANQQSTITCTQKGWSPAPECILTDIGGKCGRPPPVENGDIVDISKATYFPSETVTYQCQNFYTMEGSPTVTCQNGLWSQTPICRAACTANEEDMRVHNIKLRWSNRNKIYAEDGNTVEFVCLRGYQPHPDTRSLRASCVDGQFDYPDCIPI